MYNLLIYDHTQNRGNPKVTLADSGFMQLTENQKHMVITMFGGRDYEEMKESDLNNRKYPELHQKFDKQTIFFELKGFGLERTDEEVFKHDYQTMSVSELKTSIDTIRKNLEIKEKGLSDVLKNDKLYSSFTYENYKQTNNSENDDRNLNKLPVSSNSQLDDSINAESKALVLSSALEKTQNIKNYIMSNKIEIQEIKKNIYKHEIALYQKFTLSFACLIFFFIGAPLGAIIRKGGFGLPVIASIVFFLIYHIVSSMGKKLAEEGTFSVFQGMWLSTLIILPLGIFLTYKAGNDSNLFDIKTFIDQLLRPVKFLSAKYFRYK
jgi:lipopolysaccharide export system permease protein